MVFAHFLDWRQTMQPVHIHMRRTTDTACSLPMFSQIPPQTNGLRYGDDAEKELSMEMCIKERHFFNVRTVRGAFIGDKNTSFLHSRSTKEIHCTCYESEACQLCLKGSVVESIPGGCQGVPGTRLLDISCVDCGCITQKKLIANRRGIVIVCTALLCPNLLIQTQSGKFAQDISRGDVHKVIVDNFLIPVKDALLQHREYRTTHSREDIEEKFGPGGVEGFKGWVAS